jgi:hypothetical protein
MNSCEFGCTVVDDVNLEGSVHGEWSGSIFRQFSGKPTARVAPKICA